MIDLSIIIVNWNTAAMLSDCLRSLKSVSGGLATEVIVVDNGSIDGSADLVRRDFPHVRLIANETNVGFARANNQGMGARTGRYIALLNSDTVVREGAMATLVRFLDAHPRAGAAGPRLLNADGSLQPSCHPVLTPGREFWRLLLLDRLFPRATYPMGRWPEEPREVEVIKGACLVVRKAALDGVGLLDERYFMYSEEMDLCVRIARAGWGLYWVPAASVVHFGGASTQQAAESMYLELYRSKVAFQAKIFGRGSAWRLKLFVALAYLPRWIVAAVGGLWSRSLAVRACTYRRLLAALPGM